MKEKLTEEFESIGNMHYSANTNTPLREDAFVKTDDEKVQNIQKHFKAIMEELGLDLTDDSLSGTPYRVAKMYVKELFYGLNPEHKPKLSSFENKYGYGKMLVESNISIDSSCEHHFLPITGFAHVAYIPGERVIGLSKINRLVDYYAHRPQVQERLCLQILKDLQEALNTESVLVMISSKHLCVSSRGIKDKSSYTTTLEYGGEFNDINRRKEFFNCLNQKID
ncbi:GTP cyclohydrolase I [Roseivirga ehrenbergii]|uniref:GTP cyclohydrolase 1 n=1 Tax=Roseivirga ehrenbergii (strain DSM 102268 / JCM 13514 / KCTC 12282 / NCIMB 14502 / KMM 6017) TaxID=279360 RepID=A0A150X7Z4_ROSEK|nr:GTP cyclohydrolase I FolE [Roseivirga ehrenbergii]KYG74806.1 GTP cyclohydrolase [Roseivirga ehrenbergii]TCL13861.1 GTP cyclohydrolase I [Roseivirga ehrenbergii]